MTTGQLRNQAWDAYQNNKFELAANLYREALAAYPPHHPKAEIQIADKALLEGCAKAMDAHADFYRRMEEEARCL